MFRRPGEVNDLAAAGMRRTEPPSDLHVTGEGNCQKVQQDQC
jgi:hypothetical protein